MYTPDTIANSQTGADKNEAVTKVGILVELGML